MLHICEKAKNFLWYSLALDEQLISRVLHNLTCSFVVLIWTIRSLKIWHPFAVCTEPPSKRCVHRIIFDVLHLMEEKHG